MARKQKEKEKDMQLIQIGQTSAPSTVTIMEMFQQLAEREAASIREARERALAQHATSRRGTKKLAKAAQ